jgi:hypothetical protein
MSTLHKEVAALSRADYLAGLKRIIPPARIKQVLRDSGKVRVCPGLVKGDTRTYVIVAAPFASHIFGRDGSGNVDWTNAA